MKDGDTNVLAKAAALCGCILSLVLIDAVLFRDPYMDIGSGYCIGAISPGSPGTLSYDKKADNREYSTWEAMELDTIGGKEYILHDRYSGEIRHYSDRDSWTHVRESINAVPQGGILLYGIEAVGRSGHVVYGRTSDSYFVLDIDKNHLTVSRSQKEWEDAVSMITGSMPGRLRGINHFSNKSRPVWYLVLMVLSIICCIVFLFRKQRRPEMP